ARRPDGPQPPVLPPSTVARAPRMVLCLPQVQRFHRERRIRGHSMTIRYWPEALTDISRLPTSKTCRDLVDQAQAVALAELGSPLNIADLCEVLAVSER